jgi:hypothetical protein
MAEITAFKLCIAGATSALVALALEGALWRGGPNGGEPFWVAISDGGSALLLRVLAGALVISLFQVNCTWLAHMTCTLTVGIVSSVKIVPQTLLACLVARLSGAPATADFAQPLGHAGLVTLVLSGAVWAFSRTRSKWSQAEKRPPALGVGPDADAAAGGRGRAAKPSPSADDARVAGDRSVLPA